MKKSIPKVWERESEASIIGNDREFPLTPEICSSQICATPTVKHKHFGSLRTFLALSDPPAVVNLVAIFPTADPTPPTMML